MVTFIFNGNGGIAGVGHLWYVSLAMQLYLLAPLLFLMFSKVRKTQLKYVYWIFLVVGLVIRILEKWLGLEWYTYTYTFVFSNIDLFAGGILIAGIEKEKNICTQKNTKILSCIIFVILVIYNCYISNMNSSIMTTIYRYCLPSLYILTCSILILQFSKGGKIRKHKVLSFIFCIVNGFSQHTYIFYVFHILIFVYVSKTFCNTRFFMDLSILARYVYFFVICFVINVTIAYIFDRMMWKEGQRKNG